MDIRFIDKNGISVEARFDIKSIEAVRQKLEPFEDELKEANGYIEVVVKDDINLLNVSIECPDLELRERMYQALKPLFPY